MLAFAALLTLLPAFIAAMPQAKRQEDPQVSLTIDPLAIQPGLAQDGQGDNEVTDGQVRSLTSLNNFINFCLTQDVPLTNGQQVDGGSCNTAPIGRILAKNQQPVSMIIQPPNFSETTVENTTFDIQVRVNNIATGNAVNLEQSFLAAPQQLDGAGLVLGFTTVTIQTINGLADAEVLDPTIFDFFSAITTPAANGIQTATVNGGLGAGTYRLCSTNLGQNGGPVIISNAQHGSADSCSYFTVVAAGAGAEPAPEVPAEVEIQPVVEEPVVVEDPAVEAPVVEAPVVEDPAVEDPAVEAPVVEAPVVEAPADGQAPVEVDVPAVVVPPVVGGGGNNNNNNGGGGRGGGRGRGGRGGGRGRGGRGRGRNGRGRGRNGRGRFNRN